MGNQISIVENPDYLHLRVSGENDPETVGNYLADVYQISSRMGYGSVLIEEALSGPSLDPVDIYHIVSRASSQTSPLLKKIAYVDTNKTHSSAAQKLGEAVAHDRGVNVRIFADIETAAKWLLGDSQ